MPLRPRCTGEMQHDFVQSLMRWDAKFNNLYCATASGIISTRKFAHDGTLPVVDTWKCHTSNVMDILTLAKEGLVCTAGLDRKIFVHDASIGRYVCSFEGHRGGILALSYNRAYNFLVSAGTDCEPYLWTVNMPNTYPFTLHDANLRHMADIVAVHAVPFSAQILTLDKNGLLKVSWGLLGEVGLSLARAGGGILNTPTTGRR